MIPKGRRSGGGIRQEYHTKKPKSSVRKVLWCSSPGVAGVVNGDVRNGNGRGLNTMSGSYVHRLQPQPSSPHPSTLPRSYKIPPPAEQTCSSTNIHTTQQNRGIIQKKNHIPEYLLEPVNETSCTHTILVPEITQPCISDDGYDDIDIKIESTDEVCYPTYTKASATERADIVGNDVNVNGCTSGIGEYKRILSLNLHHFDNKLEDILAHIKYDIQRVHCIKNKQTAFAILRDVLMKFSFSMGSAIKSFDIIVETYKKYSDDVTSPNYDTINNLWAEDLLYIIYENIVEDDNTECIDCLMIQLSDMESGMCPQGRVTRLLQIIVMFDNTFI